MDQTPLIPGNGNEPALPVPPEFNGWRDVFSRREIAQNVAVAWLTRRQWMHRRVDQFDFQDDLLVSCRSSIDLTIPESAPIVRAPWVGTPELIGPDDQVVRVLPLFLADKGQVTVGFDLRDESNHPVSRLRAEQSGVLGGKILVTMAEKILKVRAPLPADDPLRVAAMLVARSENVSTGPNAWSQLVRTCLSEEQGKVALAHDEGFKYLVQLLAESHLMCALVPGKPNQQRILKIAADYQFVMTRRLRELMGWVDFAVEIKATHAADPASYHCHINVPAGVDIRRARLKADPATDADGALPYDIAGQTRRPRYGHFIAMNCAREHNYADCVALQMMRRGWLNAALASGLGISALLFLCWRLASSFVDAHDEASNSVHTDVVLLFATLFLASEATIITILAKSEEHRLTSEMLKLLRLAMFGLALLPFVAVLVLGFARTSDTLSTVFAILAWVSLLFLAPLFLAYSRPWRALVWIFRGRRS